MKIYIVLLLFLVFGCASNKTQLSDDICFCYDADCPKIELMLKKAGKFLITISCTPLLGSNEHGSMENYTGEWKPLENDEIVLISDTDMTTLIFREFSNSKDFQKINSSTLRLNTLADSLQVTDGIWLYRTTCDLKGVKMRRGTIDSFGVFRRDK